jgi:molecular chaperone HscB
LLDQRYRVLSRMLHPDYFHNRDAAERRASLARSSYLNDAYRTLRQPASRLAYLLKVEGAAAPGSDGLAPLADAQVPAALLEEVFALNEELDWVRDERARGVPEPQWRARLEQARGPIDAKRSRHEAELQELSAKWDEVVDHTAGEHERREVLSALRHRMVERNYIVNLLAGIERELSQK